jgi:hypothetical protein
MAPRNRDTANIDQDQRAAMAGTPTDNDTVPEGEWVAGRRGVVSPATARDDAGQPVADFRGPLDADTAPPSRLNAPATGAHAAPPPATPAGSGARPVAAEAGATFVTNADAYRAGWVRIQSGFVDDPQASVAEAADLVAQISGSLVSAVQDRERTLRGSWEGGGNADTEALRNALRDYRSFFERLMNV